MLLALSAQLLLHLREGLCFGAGSRLCGLDRNLARCQRSRALVRLCPGRRQRLLALYQQPFPLPDSTLQQAQLKDESAAGASVAL